MTEAEMYLIRHMFFETNEIYVYFDERGDDKRLLFATADGATMARYVIESPISTPAKKKLAKRVLRNLIKNDNSVSAVQQTPFEEDNRVLYCSRNFGQAE